MKKLFLLLFAVGMLCSAAYSALAEPDKMAEIVTRADGSKYIQCINPGSNCAT